MSEVLVLTIRDVVLWAVYIGVVLLSLLDDCVGNASGVTCSCGSRMLPFRREGTLCENRLDTVEGDET